MVRGGVEDTYKIEDIDKSTQPIVTGRNRSARHGLLSVVESLKTPTPSDVNRLITGG
jgi:hypothetical protein